MVNADFIVIIGMRRQPQSWSWNSTSRAVWADARRRSFIILGNIH